MKELRYEICEGPLYPMFNGREEMVFTVVVKFKKFRYAFHVSDKMVGHELIQRRERLHTFLRMLVDTEIVPRIEEFGKCNQYLGLYRRDGGGFHFRLGKSHCDKVFEPERRKHTPNPVSYFFHDPPMWVGKDLWKEGILKKHDFDELVFDEVLPKTNIRIAVTRDAEFHFDFSNYYPARLSPRSWQMGLPASNRNVRFAKDAQVKRFQTRVINCFLGLVYTGRSIRRNATPVMYCHSGNILTSSSVKGPGGGPAEAQRQQQGRRDQKSDNPSVLFGSPYIISRGVFPPFCVNSLRKAAELLDFLLVQDDLKVFDKVVLWHHAWFDLSKKHFSSALLKAWLLIESTLNEAWKRYLYSQSRPMQDHRKAPRPFMSEGRVERLGRLNAASKVDLLALVGEVPDCLLDETHLIRDSRNLYVHTLEDVDRETAQLSIALSERYIEIFDEFTIRSGFRPYLPQDVLSWEEHLSNE